MKKTGHLIKHIAPGSIAEELELEPGDWLLSIDGEEIADIFDYQYKIGSEAITMVVRKKDGEEWELDIENNYEDPGITFENGLMSEYKSCHNKCIFCFIDQMPPGMRDTLYFKDDDSRLSFLQGNYITLTNMKEQDIERIIRFKLAPINISVHTMNPELRCKMLGNRFAGEALSKMDMLFKAEIPMNGQIVLCKGVNDGKELSYSISELIKYMPYMQSVSVVPVGISRYREGLFPMESFTKQDAAEIIDLVEGFQRQVFTDRGSHFIHCSDEIYMLAERELPEEERYDDYIQLENGVGMIRLMTAEVEKALMKLSGDDGQEELSLATGVLAFPYIRKFVKRIQEKYPNRAVHVHAIQNRFFGEQITVAGLITGQDLIEQLKGKKLGSRLLLPSVMFRNGEEVFLDDITREEAERALQVKIDIVKSSGCDFVNAVLNREEPEKPSYEEEAGRRHGDYELN